MRWRNYVGAGLTVAALVGVLRLASVEHAAHRRAPAAAGRRRGRALLGHRSRAAGGRLGRRRFSYYFLPPEGFGIDAPDDWVAFVTFLVTAIVAGELASRAERRTAEARAGAAGDRAALPGAARGVRARERSRSGAAQRAAEGGAARRADAQPADAADRHQGGGDGADRRRRLDRRTSELSSEGRARAAAGHRRRVGSAQPVHRRAVVGRSAGTPPQPPTRAASGSTTSSAPAWRAPRT